MAKARPILITTTTTEYRQVEKAAKLASLTVSGWAKRQVLLDAAFLLELKAKDGK